jgi:hypothetical protein
MTATTRGEARRQRDPGTGVVACPECGGGATVTDEGVVGSTDGPLAVVRVACTNRHWFLMSQDRLPSRQQLRSAG